MPILQEAATRIGEPNRVAMGFFFLFIATTLGITWWAARRTRTTEQFYAAGRTISPGQNGIALAGECRPSSTEWFGPTYAVDQTDGRSGEESSRRSTAPTLMPFGSRCSRFVSGDSSATLLPPGG